MINVISHNLLALGSEEQVATSRVLASGRIVQGPEADTFEDDYVIFGLLSGYAVVLFSGDAGLYLYLWVMNGKIYEYRLTCLFMRRIAQRR